MQYILKSATLLAIVMLCSCKDSSTNSSIPGNMVGYVTRYDSSGVKTDNSGVRISIDGTNYSTLSDSKGRWELQNVLPGTYNISFTKEGYATEKNIAYRFVGNGTDYLFNQKIYQIAFRNVSFVIRAFVSGQTIFSVRLYRVNAIESVFGGILLLFGRDSAFSLTKPLSYLYKVDNLSISRLSSDSPFDFSITASELLKAGFHSGENVFCQAFGSNLFVGLITDQLTGEMSLGPSYLDIATNKRIYTGFGNNHSEVKSFVLP